MLRRGFRVLSASNVVKTVETGLQNAPSSEGSTISTRRIKIEVANEILKDFRPSASAAPQLLEAYVEPKPFISQKNFQLFAVSFLVGGATVCAVYLLLSSSIAEDLEREYLYADGIRESNERHATLLKEFVAPSSYKYLQDKMERRQAENRDQEMERVSVLHSEVLYRVKIWWNRQLTLIDSVFTRMWERRRIRSEFETIRAAVALRGFDVVNVVTEAN